MSNDMRTEITRRARWLLKHKGTQHHHNDFYRRCVVGEFDIGDYLDDIMIYRTRNRDGVRALEFSSRWGPNIGKNLDYDEWQRILNAFRQAMVLEDLADA